MPIFPQFEENISAVDNQQGSLLLGLNIHQLVELCECIGLEKYRATQISDAVYSQWLDSIEAITVLPLRARNALVKSGYRIGLPEIAETFTSTDGTERYLVTCPGGETVETVWMPNGDDGELGDGSQAAEEEIAVRTCDGAFGREQRRMRATICISSQAGCAVNCRFCLTAKLGIKRNLTAGEITGQVVAVLKRHRVRIGRDRINIVFMGMGEPFLNYDNFMAAVRLLVQRVGIPESRMTVSTSGIAPGIKRFSKEKIRPKLALSLNAPNDRVREEIMPITRKWNIDTLLVALQAVPLRPRERLTFEYVLLGGVNDRPQDARELAELVTRSGLRAKVNLIAWNPGPDIPYRTPAERDVAAFQQHLIDAGIPAFLRCPRGRDIYAACGQLKRTKE